METILNSYIRTFSNPKREILCDNNIISLAASTDLRML